MSEKKKGKQKAVNEESDDEDDEGYRWWEAQNAKGDGTVKWNTLEHNGVYFPPEYVPHNVKMKYDGMPFFLWYYINVGFNPSISTLKKAKKYILNQKRKKLQLFMQLS